jgi:hypothetical protein
MRQLLREPLVHFVVAGGVLFAAYVFVQGPLLPSADGSAIVVDRRALLSFMQYRANAFEAGTFAAALDAMSSGEVQELVEAYVDEEILYREARALGLDESDYVIRQRMIQKIDFLLGDAADAASEIDEHALAAYFAAHREEYAIEPSVTFTHVFFDRTRRGTQTRTDAVKALAELDAAGAGFNDAGDYGDRFPFLKNYVERTLDHVSSHFGAEFAADLASLPSSPGRWQGPLRSVYGEHVVLLTEKTERRYPELAEIRSEIEREYLELQATAQRAALLDRLRERYRVDVRLDDSR